MTGGVNFPTAVQISVLAKVKPSDLREFSCGPSQLQIEVIDCVKQALICVKRPWLPAIAYLLNFGSPLIWTVVGLGKGFTTIVRHSFHCEKPGAAPRGWPDCRLLPPAFSRRVVATFC